jgi:cysteinyl-tRNA synthetase
MWMPSDRKTRFSVAAFALLGSLAWMTQPAFAQAQQPGAAGQAPAPGGQGYVRIQGRDQGGGAVAPIPGSEALLNLREEMRKFIQSISSYARRAKPNFIIIVQDGLELLVKRDDVDENRISPARTYMRSIDGVLAQNLFYDIKTPGKPPPPDRQRGMLNRAQFAKDNGLPVFTLDFGQGKAVIDDVHKQARTRGYIAQVANEAFEDVSELPSYPERPFGENPGSIVSLRQVKNYALVTNSQPFGREDEFALAMHDNNFDMLIVEVFHGRRPLSRQAVETLKYKKLGAKRLVLASMNLGAAASYAYYWKPNWREGSPGWINAPVRGDPDRYNVQFWNPAWQQIIYGNPNSFVYGLIAQGFDGVVITGVEAFKFFEGGGEEETREGQ